MSRAARLASLTAAGLFGGISTLAADSAIAQDGPAEFTSAPCSSLALGPGDEISHLERIYLFKGAEQTTQYKFFAEETCTKPLYSFVFKGQVELGEPVDGLPDTVEAKVTFERILFTRDSPRGAAAAADRPPWHRRRHFYTPGPEGCLA